MVEFWKRQAAPEYDQTFLLAPPAEDDELDAEDFDGTQDPLYQDAVRVVLGAGEHPARNPDQNIADLKAQAASCTRGISELQRAAELYGADGLIDDPVSGISYDNGTVRANEAPGFGVAFNPATTHFIGDYGNG